MTVVERSKPVYAAMLYHDDEEDAATRSKHVGYYPSLKAATQAINAGRNDEWQTGGVTEGRLFAEVFGERPEYFESDYRSRSWFVGTDGKADR